MKSISIFLLVSFAAILSNAQTNIGIGTATPDASARLDVSATNKGILVPRISLTNVASATPITSPATGLLVWNTNAVVIDGTGLGFYYWDGTQWQKLIPANEGWKLSGNAATNPANQFLGTTDNQPLSFRVNNIQAGRIDHNLYSVFLGVKAGLNTNPTDEFNSRNNTFIGDSAGFSNTTGGSNSFVGKESGLNNTTANANSFFGFQAGQSNTTGQPNSFFGFQCGQDNSTGGYNSFYGYFAGQGNSTGSENSFFGANAGRGDISNGSTGIQNSAFGRMAGQLLTTGSNNAIFGAHAGRNNSTGNENTFIGDSAGYNNDQGLQNTFVGKGTGLDNSTGNLNSLFGYLSNVSIDNLTNATAIGARSLVSSSNSLVLGSINGVNGATNDTKVGIGTTAPSAKLDISGDVKIGSQGTVITNIIKTTISYNAPPISGGSSFSAVIPVTNAALSSSVVVSPGSALPDGLVIAYVRVPSAGNVEIKFTNITTSPIDAALMNYFVTIIQ